MIFDSHAHYEDGQFEEDRKGLLESFAENGVGAVVNVSSSLASIEESLKLTKEYSFVYAAVGVHPQECGKLDEDKISWVKDMLGRPKVVALGEIGLDYYWDEPDRQIQKIWFERQMEMAKEAGLPMIVHSRDAAADTLDMMKAAHAQDAGGVVHCFSYGVDMAGKFLDMGFYLGIGGVVTFANAKKLKEVAAYAPMDRILLETDSPYLAPVPNRGKRNSSLNLIYVAKEIGAIRGMDTEEVIRLTEENARRMYGLEGKG